jgi:hypothetical protein
MWESCTAYRSQTEPAVFHLSFANIASGGPRIHGELLKLGIDSPPMVSTSTVKKSAAARPSLLEQVVNDRLLVPV